MTLRLYTCQWFADTVGRAWGTEAVYELPVTTDTRWQECIPGYHEDGGHTHVPAGRIQCAPRGSQHDIAWLA